MEQNPIIPDILDKPSRKPWLTIRQWEQLNVILRVIFIISMLWLGYAVWERGFSPCEKCSFKREICLDASSTLGEKCEKPKVVEISCLDIMREYAKSIESKSDYPSTDAMDRLWNNKSFDLVI